MKLLALAFASLLMLVAAGHDAGAQATIVGPSDRVQVVISDWDLNANPRGVDSYDEPDFVVFRTDRSDVGEAHPDIEETGPSTGLFEFTVQLETDELACQLDFLGEPRFAAKGGSDPSVGVCPGDVLLVQYEDNMGAGGMSTMVDYAFEVKSWNPEFSADNVSYAPGDRIAVSIFDPDANRDPDVPDSLRDVRVFSESDPAGQQLSAIETGPNTGNFRLSFVTSLQSQGNAILVSENDEVTIQYTDEFPSDFASFEEDREFSFVIVLGASSSGGLDVSDPLVMLGESTDVDSLVAGQQATLISRASNPFSGQGFPLVTIIEVRDSDGLTVFLGWQSGFLKPEDEIVVGMSWTPDRQGEHDIRTFLVSSLINPMVLSAVASSQVTVAAEGN